MDKHKHVAKRDSASYQWEDNAPPARRGPRKAVVIPVVVVCVLLILFELVYLVFGHFYSKLNYSEAMTQEERAAAISAYMDMEQQPAEGGLPSGEANDTLDENGQEITAATDQEVDDLHARIQAALAANGGSLISDSDVVNILLVGSDARSRSERARSDVMMMVSLSKKVNKIVLTSFMRDIYTHIPDYGYHRLNTPNSIAGPEYLVETLEADFGIDIDNYAAVNFYDFADVIDAVGGVDVYLSNNEVTFINNSVNGDQARLGVGTGATWLDYTDGGMAHLNGTQALAHCRNRNSADGDISRTARQREVISALIEKARSLSLTELYNLVDVVFPMVTTDLTKGDCLSLILNSAEYLSYDIESIRIPEVDYYFTMINGMSVISIDFESNAAVIRDAIYG